MMTIGEIRKTFLSSSSGTRLAPEDFYVLLAHASGTSREYLLAHPEYGIDAETEARMRGFFARRLAHEPVAYITGEKEFFGLPFRVTSDTLIQRPETELLVEQIIEQSTVNKKQKPDRARKILIADIGTGSGAIIVSLAHTLKQADTRFKIQDSRFDLHATDISRAALEIAKENAERNGVADMISFHEGDLIGPIERVFHEADDIILAANLPYLSETIHGSASEDVKGYEPRQALIAEEDGLALYRKSLTDIARLIGMSDTSKRVIGFFEISPEQDAPIRTIFSDTFPDGKSDVLPDLSGRSRVFSFRINKR